MTVFVNFIYHHGPHGSSKPELVEVAKKDLKIDLPQSAQGFTFLEADNKEEALELMGSTSSYFLGNADQIVTRPMLEVAASFDSFAKMLLHGLDWSNEIMAANGNREIEGYFNLPHGHSQIGMYEGDVLLDPKTRDVLFTMPKHNKLG